MAVVSVLRLELSTEITHFLAPGDDPRLAKLSKRLTSAELTRTVILTVEGPDLEGPDSEGAKVARLASDEIAASMADDPETAWIRNGWDPNQNDAFFELYFSHRLGMIAPSEAELDEAVSEEGLRKSAQGLLKQLSLPTAPLAKSIAPRDPMLSYGNHLRRLEQAREGSLDVVEDHFVDGDGRAVIFLASEHSPFQSGHQRPFQEAITAAIDEVEQRHGVMVEQSGMGRFALEAETGIKRDITRISVLSTVGIIIVFLLMFRSPRLVLLSLLPLAFGVVTATFVSLLLFTTIHGLTLAFGASLLGICIDYPVHLFNHHTLEPDPDGAEGTLKRIRGGLYLGALTTIAGFGGLGWTSFPGVREIAVFATVGIAAALLCTVFVVPPLMPKAPVPGKLQSKLAERCAALVDWMQRRRLWMAALPGVAIVLCAIGLPRVVFIDDVSALTRQNPTLLEEDERVRARVSRMDAGRLIVTLADSDGAALAQNDEVAAILSEQRAAGNIEAYRSLHTFLWSPQTQRKNHAATYGDPDFFPRLERAYEAEGFAPGAFEELREELEEGAPEPLSFDDVRGSAIGSLVGSFRTELDGEVGILTFVRGVNDASAVAAAVEEVEGTRLFDQGKVMADIYGRHRRQTLQLVGLGLIGVLLMVGIRYRHVGLSLAAFVPAVLAAATTLAMLSIAGVEISLLHVVSLLLVLSMGVDYGVFLAESRDHPGGVPATILSLIIACISTVLAFGLLGMSQNPALQAIGLTTGLGVLTSLVLAPTSLVLLGGRTLEGPER